MSFVITTECAAPGQRLALHLVEEISHRVVNEYAEAISMLALAARRGHASARPALTLAADRLRAKAEAHRALLIPLGNGSTDLGSYVGRLCASLSEASLREQGVQLTLKTDEIWLDPARCWRVGLIVSELVRNAARHGPKGEEGAIEVALGRAGGSVRCLVRDNGSAVPDAPEGRGRRLVRILATELGGSIEWRFTQTGSFANLQFLIVPADSPSPPKAAESEGSPCP
jgi:two-component sensor histidine kinase